ncbi:hypothetical protein V5O48_016488 [Marasmius crinis-equi]|uniref:MYND-type domain-containing protein n=1 Tax=Marasmius crinis-equi TaxID=585013 RepID=A0ABR3ERV5_9AGAR
MKLDKVRVQKNPSLPQETRKTSKQQQANFLKTMYGPSKGKEVHKDDMKALKGREAQRGISCRWPQCSNWEEPGGEKFKRCARCYNEQKRVWFYCSRECQIKDWRVNHKAICGKPIAVEAAQQAFVARKPGDAPEVRQVGPTKDGFKRSPALVEHVHKLNLHPTVDFYARIARGNGHGDFIQLDTPFKPVQCLVRAAREEAMCAGNKRSAAMLCHFFVWLLWAQHQDEVIGVDFDVLLEQMAKEFEMEKMLKDMILELEELQQEDRFQRPLLLADLPEPIWQDFLDLGELDIDRELPYKRDTEELPDWLERVDQTTYFDHRDRSLVDMASKIRIQCAEGAQIVRRPGGYFMDKRKLCIYEPPPPRSSTDSASGPSSSPSGSATVAEAD